jgi:hypothetical protein
MQITKVNVRTGEVIKRNMTPEEIAALPKISEEQKAKEEQERVNQESLAYLKETDWYVIRFQENGTPIPEDVLAKRQEARDKVIR